MLSGTDCDTTGCPRKRNARERCAQRWALNLHCNFALSTPRSAADKEAVQMLMMILLAVLVFALLGGAVGHSRYGYAGWSPAGIMVVILLLWFFTGHHA
jgi:hypothetical protein